MVNVYNAIKQKNPDANQKEIDRVFSRSISQLFYNKGDAVANQWRAGAGYQYGYGEEEERKYFIDKLGLSQSDYKYLRQMIRLQQFMVSSPKKYSYMIRNEEFLQLRESYIEIGKMVQKYGYGQYNGILRILMGQVNCIDSDESDGEKMKYLTESYSKLFASRGGLSDFIIYDADVQLRNQLNEKYNDEVKKVWNIMKDYS